MNVKNISVPLTTEEREALYQSASRECRRPIDQVRYLLRRGLGLTDSQAMESIDQIENDAGDRQVKANVVPNRSITNYQERN